MENSENIRDILLLLGPVLSGLLISHLTDFLKELGVWGALRDEEKKAFNDIVPRIIAVGLSILMAWLSTLIPWLNQDVSTMVLFGSYPVAQLWHELRARRQILGLPEIEEFPDPPSYGEISPEQ